MTGDQGGRLTAAPAPEPTAPADARAVARRHFQRNYLLGVVSGSVFGFSDSITASSLVLSVFVASLGGSNVLVALLPAIATGGWYLPQFLISHLIQRLPRKSDMYVAMAWVRIVCWVLIVGATFWLGNRNPGLLLGAFFLLFTTYSLAAGAAGTPYYEMVAKTIPASWRAAFFGRRDLLGALLGLAAGYVVNYFLGPAWTAAFPQNFALIFVVATVAIVIGLATFCLMVEPYEPVTAAPVSFWGQVSAARRLVRQNPVYRRYLTTRLALTVADIALPFYPLYATRVLGVPLEMIGTYIGLATGAGLATNLIWSRLSERRGNRLVVQGLAAGALLMPLLALAFGFLGPSPALGLGFGLVYVVAGAVRPAANIGLPSYMLEIAPAAERPLYVAFTNTALGIATILPVFGGVIVDLAGYTAVILAAALIAAAGLWLALGLAEPRIHAFTPAPAVAPVPKIGESE